MTPQMSPNEALGILKGLVRHYEGMTHKKNTKYSEALEVVVREASVWNYFPGNSLMTAEQMAECTKDAKNRLCRAMGAEHPEEWDLPMTLYLATSLIKGEL